MSENTTPGGTEPENTGDEQCPICHGTLRERDGVPWCPDCDLKFTP